MERLALDIEIAVVALDAQKGIEAWTYARSQSACWRSIPMYR